MKFLLDKGYVRQQEDALGLAEQLKYLGWGCSQADVKLFTCVATNDYKLFHCQITWAKLDSYGNALLLPLIKLRTG